MGFSLYPMYMFPCSALMGILLTAVSALWPLQINSASTAHGEAVLFFFWYGCSLFGGIPLLRQAVPEPSPSSLRSRRSRDRRPFGWALDCTVAGLGLLSCCVSHRVFVMFCTYTRDAVGHITTREPFAYPVAGALQWQLVMAWWYGSATRRALINAFLSATLSRLVFRTGRGLVSVVVLCLVGFAVTCRLRNSSGLMLWNQFYNPLAWIPHALSAIYIPAAWGLGVVAVLQMYRLQEVQTCQAISHVETTRLPSQSPTTPRRRWWRALDPTLCLLGMALSVAVVR